ncbi:zinc ribbon domain-containing protein [Natronomonas gomsonensis]|jgi:predicted transcriptional regulator/RNA polymerase subunit RPABC4/transcription elongation factor Spt4|uniref:double zinc ribbon domain-containing protein n=1 Tax=Natronomonas gomsonensis TaxID=1046043 RepID=UPI0020CA3034|nr:zinc ribbon domain-containing protein [Natronomonas gomsonensis]MCY4730766.1 zinc ribbon domain-containing protein [Natronomonas gomsonensis]
MSKITFRADDDLVRQLEAYDASKSEVMREALRAYLDEGETSVNTTQGGANADSTDSIAEESLDDLIAERVDALIADRLDRSFTPREPQDVNVNITLDGDSAGVSHETGEARKTDEADPENASDAAHDACKQCGEELTQSDVYCPNCGEKASHRVFCECGDEVRSDWAFCPSCGRRTTAADVLGDT